MSRPRKPNALSAAERMRAYRLRKSVLVTETPVTRIGVTETPVTKTDVTETPVTVTPVAPMSVFALYELNGRKPGFWVRRANSTWGMPHLVVSVSHQTGEVRTSDNWLINKPEHPCFELVRGC